MMAEPLPGQITHRNSFGRSYLNKQLLHMLVMLVTFHGSHMVAPLRCKLGHSDQILDVFGIDDAGQTLLAVAIVQGLAGSQGGRLRRE